ncbi:MAG: hypothetical protein EBR33_13630, partial [Synechococcaceae bacterium WB4_1_0192]|nr:hypothetical protein [Synechococcaceae bacterium WB4_1_0192]
DLLGVQLLSRGPGTLTPTAEGQRLAEGVAAAIRLLQSTLDQLQPGPLTLSCSASILTHWLIPRLSRFYQDYPQVELQFNVNYGPVDVIRENIGVAIRNTMVPPPQDVVVRELVTEWIGPVCTPEYMRRQRIRTAADLANARLMTAKTRPKAWTEWSRAAGLPSPMERYMNRRSSRHTRPFTPARASIVAASRSASSSSCWERAMLRRRA